MLNRMSIEAQIIGYNCITPLVFNDPQSAQRTLEALRASPHIIYGAVRTPAGRFFAGYWRSTQNPGRPLPLPVSSQIRNGFPFDSQYGIVQPIFLDNKLVGTVYVRSDVAELIARLESYLPILGEGFDAMAASTGEAGLSSLQSFTPDVIISDVVMPGMNGVELGIRVRSLFPKCRIILFSGQTATVDLLSEARKHGHEFEIVPKPIKPQRLIAMIRDGVGN